MGSDETGKRPVVVVHVSDQLGAVTANAVARHLLRLVLGADPDKRYAVARRPVGTGARLATGLVLRRRVFVRVPRPVLMPA